MTISTVNGVKLFYKVTGNGSIPLVLVHGSWTSHKDWDLVVPSLSESFRVVTYDRRGHSQSERPDTQGSVHEDVTDLASLIEHLDIAPAWIVGNSYGASIALRITSSRPDLVRGVIAHEPPLFVLGMNAPTVAEGIERSPAQEVVRRIESGDPAGAAELFIEEVALGPGSWALLPQRTKETMIQNAPTFLDETNDPDQLVFDKGASKNFNRPALLSLGDRSPPIFSTLIARLSQVLPEAETVTFKGAGHIPHVTNPADYVEMVSAFITNNPDGSRPSA